MKNNVPGDKDLATFWLIQTGVHLKKNDLKSAIRFYALFSGTNTLNFMLPSIQTSLLSAIDTALKMRTANLRQAACND